MGSCVVGTKEQLPHNPSGSYVDRHAIPLVFAASVDRVRQRARNSADALQQRPSRRSAFHAVFVDNELLPEERGSRGRRFPLVVFSLPCDISCRRDRSLHSRAVDRQPHLSCGFCRKLSYVYSACKYSSLYS